jgi:sodium-dependent dicarboxylate transporter 2/3/5
MVMALPISIVMLVIAWLLITKVFFPVPEHVTVDHAVVEEQATALGPVV